MSNLNDEVESEAAALALDPDEFYRILTARNTGIVSKADQLAVADARILVAGCGSIGGAAVEPLVRFGFRRLILADPGTFELKNLNRQNATVGDLGRNKALVAAERALAVNPHVEVTIVEEGVTLSSIDGLLEGVNLVVDGVDVTTATGLAAKALLHSRAQKARLPTFTGWDMSGTQYVRLYDYRNGLRPFDGEVTLEQMEQMPMWKLLARLVPAHRVPRDLIRLIHDGMSDLTFTFPQLVYAADQFGVLATGLAFRLVTGRHVPPHVFVDVHAITSPLGERILNAALRPAAAVRMLASIVFGARAH